MTFVPKDWGHEYIVTNNELYCLKILVCEDQQWSSKGKFHYHRIKDETFLVINGTLELETIDEDGTIRNGKLKEGESIRILPGTKHRFRSVGERCSFVEASSPDSPSDSVRVDDVPGAKSGQS